jgi:hypothetical protein
MKEIKISTRLAQNLLDYVRMNSIPKVPFVEVETMSNALIAAANASHAKAAEPAKKAKKAKKENDGKAEAK